MKTKVHRHKPVPEFQGTTEHRLAQLLEWRDNHEPGRIFTCREVGQVAGLTGQGILEIERRAKRKLRYRANKLLEAIQA